jgi:sortase A
MSFYKKRRPENENDTKARRKRRRARRLGALFVVPVVFVLLTVLLIHAALAPVIGPYVDLAMLFIGSDSQETGTGSRDLLTQAASPSPDFSGGGPDSHAPMVIKRSEIIVPKPGDLYGNITISGTRIDAPVYWDDSPRELNKGVGTYAGGWLPGFGRTVMMAGHRDTDFKDLGSAQIGAVITIVTHYETYTYEITDIAVFHMNDEDSYDFTVNEENIILYTCYPFDFIGAARERFFVYGRLLTGTPVDRFS